MYRIRIVLQILKGKTLFIANSLENYSYSLHFKLLNKAIFGSAKNQLMKPIQNLLQCHEKHWPCQGEEHLVSQIP